MLGEVDGMLQWDGKEGKTIEGNRLREEEATGGEGTVLNKIRRSIGRRNEDSGSEKIY